MWKSGSVELIVWFLLQSFLSAECTLLLHFFLLHHRQGTWRERDRCSEKKEHPQLDRQRERERDIRLSIHSSNHQCEEIWSISNRQEGWKESEENATPFLSFSSRDKWHEKECTFTYRSHVVKYWRQSAALSLFLFPLFCLDLSTFDMPLCALCMEGETISESNNDLFKFRVKWTLFDYRMRVHVWRWRI